MPIRPELRHLYRTESYLAARQTARERSGDRCERCGCSNGTYVEKQNVGISGFVRVFIQCGAAHLDQNPENNDPSNVAWLCRGCHLRFDAKFHVPKARETRKERKDRKRPILVKAREPYQVSIEEVL